MGAIPPHGQLALIPQVALTREFSNRLLNSGGKEMGLPTPRTRDVMKLKYVWRIHYGILSLGKDFLDSRENESISNHQFRLCVSRVILSLFVVLQAAIASTDEKAEMKGGATLMSAEPTGQASEIAAGNCVCLRESGTGNLVKNCLAQKRSDENVPRILCEDDKGRMTHRDVRPDSSILPGDHPDCQPCEDPTWPPIETEVPRG